MALSRTSSFNDCVLLRIDVFSHWIDAQAFRSVDQDAIILFLFNRICQYGLLKRLIWVGALILTVS
jgi:hypothetical protein